MKTLMLLTYISVFLSGVFVSLLISTARLSDGQNYLDLLASGQYDAPRAGGNGTVRGPPGGASTAAELRRQLLAERERADDLQRRVEGLQSGGNAAGAALSSKDSDASFKRRLLDSFLDKRPADLCSALPEPTPTALSLWSNFQADVFNSTQHAADQDYTFHDFTALLLHFMTPDRLQRSVKTLPLDWTPVGRSLAVVRRRLDAIRARADEYRSKNGLGADAPIPPDVWRGINDDKSLPRRLNVLVMGGSVTMGVVCHINPVTTQTGKYSRRNCAWPGRVARFLNGLLGHELVDFHTLALGGTNTESGGTMWDYALLPDVPYPDVVINAYATNDMHYNSVQDAIARNWTLGQSVFELGQSYVRQLMTPKQRCRHAPPLLIYLDDYLGNEQDEVMETLTSSQTINLLAGYYGVASMSYGDAVRDMVYGDNKEWWFSSHWFEGGKYQRAVHPHMGMHIAMVWVVAFNLLNLVTTYCSLPISTRSGQRIHSGNEKRSDGKWDYGYVPENGLPTLRASKQLEGGPAQKPRGLPPMLTQTLSLERISDVWREDISEDTHLWTTPSECQAQGHSSEGDDHEPLPKPCIYSWVANLERKLDNPKRLTDKIKPHMTSNEGWSAADDNNKLGWVPSGLGSKFTLEFKRINHEVRAVTWMIMRSYGEKWSDSRLKVDVYAGDELLKTEEVVGYHDKKTSETYNIKMKLARGVKAGEDVRIQLELVGGSTFKISGMAVCDH